MNPQFGHDPFPGQPNQPYPYQAGFVQTLPGSLSMNHQTFPGLGMNPAQNVFGQNHNMIPGLAFGFPSNDGSWAPQHSQEEPNLIPASQYYKSPLPSNVNQGQEADISAEKSADTAEEGELSEGVFDDLYEPTHLAGHELEEKDDDYEPQDAVWYEKEPLHQDRAQDAAGRGRSGSYSPYLSPRELRPAKNHALSTQPAVADPYFEALSEAKKNAQTAILDLWPLDVRFKNYIEEGIDAAFLRNLFKELGLDPSTVTANQLSQIPGVQPSLRSTTNRVQTMTNTRSQPVAEETPTESTATVKPLAKSNSDKSEERKDRIARLLAAKAAKSGSGVSRQSPSQSEPIQEVQSAQPKALSEKEVQLQQKMEALKKSRLARVGKTTAKNKSSATSNTSSGLTGDQTFVPNSNAVMGTHFSGEVSAGDTASAVALSPSTNGDNSRPLQSAIPGLFAQPASQGRSSAQTRKRPVAADFVDDSQSQSLKRPFGQNRSARLVIDVSDASDDEDVEMDMGSGDESTPNIQMAASLQGLSDGRDHRSLADFQVQRRVASPAGNNSASSPHPELMNMDKKIEEMKKKIALAEARKKLKKVMGDNKSISSQTQTPEAAADSDSAQPTKPALQRVQSLNLPPAPDRASSPAVLETASIKLPKRPDVPHSVEPQHGERVRSLSQSLSLTDGKLQAKKSRLRLLLSQIARLEKEIEQEAMTQQQMKDELDILQQTEDTTNSGLPEPSVGRQVAAYDLSIGVDPNRDSTIEQQNSTAASPPKAEQQSEKQASSDRAQDLSEFTQPNVCEASNAGNATEDARQQDGPSEADLANASVGKPASPPLQVAPRTVHFDNTLEEQPQEQAEALFSPESMEVDTRSTDSEPSDAGHQFDQTPPEQQDMSSRNLDEVADVVPLDATDSQRSSPGAEAIPDQISQGLNDTTPDEGLGHNRELQPTSRGSRSVRDKAWFLTYESPFECFREYRYHPEYRNHVAGGLRSLTYSNKIDPKLPLCPDQLDGRTCPKGDDCQYQHFDTMQLPDDQILLQLGRTTLEGAEKAQFNNGLRDLLHNLRQRNIKDFPRIAQEIIDYRNRFSNDSTKILSLGNITL